MQQKVLDFALCRPYNGFVQCSNRVPPKGANDFRAGVCRLRIQRQAGNRPVN